MSLSRFPNPLRRAAGALDFELSEEQVNLVMTALAAVFAAYLAIALNILATGAGVHRFGDFYALWSSAWLVHDGSPALNYDADALHILQAELGMNPNGYNPFPYPPIFLMILAPFGRLGLGSAYVLFMGVSFALYLWAMTGSLRAWPRAAAAALAPASAITLISGQTGFLSGALMLGGLRLATGRPILAGVLFGLLAYKPQLGVLVPVALVAAGLWRTIAAAAVTVLVCAAASSFAFGVDIWPIWFESLRAYSSHFDPINALMPTIAANARLAGLTGAPVVLLQAGVAMAVALAVWRAFREGVTPRAGALLVVGTFLATPHAFNYDMPMTTAGVLWYFETRFAEARTLRLSEAVGLTLALVLPVAMLLMQKHAFAWSWAPGLWLFTAILATDKPVRAAAAPAAAPVALGGSAA